MDFPFNNSRQRQMFPAGNQHSLRSATGALNMMQPAGMQGHGMQRYPNSTYGNQQTFMQQPYQNQSQGFQQQLAGYQMGTRQGPQMQIHTQMAMQKQMFEQQKRMAEKQQKQNEELIKKKSFETQQRKLQAFKGKSGAKSNPLNELFGKKDGKSDKSGLIGSLGSGTAQKSVTKTSVFSRPGGSHSHSQMTGSSHMLHPPGHSIIDQGAPQYLSSHDTPLQGGQFQQNLHQGIKADDFGDFKGNFTPIADSEFGNYKGSRVEQTNNDDVFSDFREKKSLFPEVRSETSSIGISSSTQSRTSSLSGQQGLSSSTQSRTSSFSGQQGISSSTQSRTSSFSGQQGISSSTQSRTSSFSGQQGVFASSDFSTSRQGIPYGNTPLGFDSSVNHSQPVWKSASSIMKPNSGNTVSMFDPGSTTNLQTLPTTISTDDGNAPVKTEEAEEPEPEDPLKALYGLDLPDWVTSGTDLPGVYGDVAAKCTSGPDMIDTNVLYPILLDSELPRDTLGVIWNNANHATPGQLNHLELRIVLGLVALAQAGIKAERLTLEKLASCKAPPIPTFPEKTLKKKGEGWSFNEQPPSQDTFQRSRDDSTRGSTSSLSSNTSGSAVDPNDRYSAFRMPDHPITSTNAVVSSEMAQHTQNFHPLYTLAGHNVNQPTNSQMILPVGNINAAQPQNTQWNLSSGDKRTPSTQLKNPHWNHPSADLGGWQAPSKDADRTSVSVPSQNKFERFQSTASQSAVEDDFGDFSDFQSGKTDNVFVSSSAALLPVAGLTAAGTSQVPAISSSAMPLRTGSVASTSTYSIANNLSDLSKKQQSPVKATADDDFGAFQDSSVPPGTTLKELAQQFSSLNSNTATSMILEASPTTKKGSGENHLDDLFFKDPSNEGTGIEAATGKSNTSAHVPSVPISSISTSQNHHFASVVANETASDKYDIFRILNLGQHKSVFAMKAPDDQNVVSTLNTHATNDNFGEFETFQRQEKSTDPGVDDFGDFSNFEAQSSGKDTGDIFGDFSSSSQIKSNESFGGVTNIAKESQTAALELGSNTFQGLANRNTNFSDFESFSDSITDKNKHSSSSDIWNVSSLDQKAGPLSANSGNGDFAAFGSFASAPPSEQSGSVKLKPITDIASVPLEPSQRYKALSAEFEDVDKHVSVWGRCLNSCLLTMTTTSLLIQKMVAESVQDEILKSKEGSKYFAAVVEVYRVTRRVRASILKSAPNNAKLKGILDEIERTWKNVANLLSGSEIMPQPSSLDFSNSHVTSEEDSSLACGVCLLDVNKARPGASKHADAHLTHAGRQYHTTCANFWCNRVDSVLPSLLPICGLI